MGVEAPHDGSAAFPFVGRAVERRLLGHLLRDAVEGRAAMVVVSGAPGAGKTALLDWTRAAAVAAGAEVLRASGYETSLPFAALRRLLMPVPGLGDAFRHRDREGPRTRGLGTTVEEMSADGLAPRLVGALSSRARRRPLAVLLDDVQDLGEASRSTLTEVLLRLDDEATRSRLQLFVMLTTRHPVEPEGLADRVLRLATTRSLTIAGLDERDLFELLAAGGHLPRPAVVRELLEDTGGLPLLVESELERRRVPSGATPGSSLGPRGLANARIRSIADALDRRFEKVGPATYRLLQQAAVLGEPWASEELACVADLPVAEVEDMVAAAAAASLVVASRDGVSFVHPLVRSELLERLGSVKRRAIHRQTAERLEGVHGPLVPAPPSRSSRSVGSEVVVRVADHTLRAGHEALTLDQVEVLLCAGGIAFGWTSWDQASRFLTAAAHASAGLVDAEMSARHHLEAGRAAYFDYDGDLAEALFARAIALAGQAGDDTGRLTAAMLLARMRGGRGFRPGDHLDVSELEAVLRSDPRVPVALQVEARAALAEALIVSGGSADAFAIVASARRLAADAAPDQAMDDALGRVSFAEGMHHLTQHDLDAADVCFIAAHRHAVAAGNLLTRCLARSRRAMAGLLRGDIGRSYAELVAVEEQQVAAGFWGEAGLAAAQMAFADVLAGRPAAEDRLERAHREWRRTGFPWNAALLSASLAAWTSRSGRGLGRTAIGASALAGHGHGSSLPVTSAHAALSAVEAYDKAAARAAVGTARWRSGLRGSVTLNNAMIAVALVEVGDLLGDTAMVRAGARPLEQVYERGVLVALGWPATVPRLLAVAARRAGEVAPARRYLDHALALADREDLAPERAKVLLETARLAAAGDGRDQDHASSRGARGGPIGGQDGDARSQAETALAAAARAFDQQSMHGWVARCEDLARELRVRAVVSSAGVRRERTIFTDDIVGSTAANVRLGDPLYLEQLRVHDRIVRGRLGEFRGVELKHTGDGMNAVFDEPADAVRCALAIQADFREWNDQEPDLALEIRCGLARGPVIGSSGDVYGLVQSEAARLCQLAGTGQVLATVAVVATCGSAVAAESLGLRELRGFPSPVEVFRLAPS